MSFIPGYKDRNDVARRRAHFAIRRRRQSFCEKLARSYQRVQQDDCLEKETRTLIARQTAMEDHLSALQERLDRLACHKEKVMGERREMSGRVAHCMRHGAVACIVITLILQINSAILTWCLPSLFWEETDMMGNDINSHLSSFNDVEELLANSRKGETWFGNISQLITAIWNTFHPE